MMSFQVTKEALFLALSDRRSLWWYISLLVIGPLFIAISWPGENLAVFLKIGAGPKVLSTLTLVCTIYIFGAGGAFVLDRSSLEPGYTFDRWIRFTPVGTFAYLHGRLLFHFIHTIVLVCLMLPLLTIAGAGSLASFGQSLYIAGVFVFVSFCQRVAAEAGRNPVRITGPLGYLVYILALIMYLMLTFTSFPEWSVIRVLSQLSVNRGGALNHSSLLKTGALHLILAAAGYAVAIWRLHRAARVARVS
ncbi:MAG: hypothetical protein DRP60_13835 [Spirochaetes bacterium]|nr:MAG: hypothetical protein DRP60_13835 [Spirochaetota bacterium]